MLLGRPEPPEIVLVAGGKVRLDTRVKCLLPRRPAVS
jgi:hypothetical protein